LAWMIPVTISGSLLFLWTSRRRSRVFTAVREVALSAKVKFLSESALSRIFFARPSDADPEILEEISILRQRISHSYLGTHCSHSKFLSDLFNVEIYLWKLPKDIKRWFRSTVLSRCVLHPFYIRLHNLGWRSIAVSPPVIMPALWTGSHMQVAHQFRRLSDIIDSMTLKRE
jgi:hypothetical protein